MTEDAAVAVQATENEKSTPFHTTYRLQLTPEMTFERAIEQLDYLKTLGISTLYLSPPFEAKEGSTHGYDGIDPTKIREELGGEAGLRKLSEEAKKRGMGVMIDWVPNHLAFDPKNQTLEDVFMWGPKSDFAEFFQIDWEKENGKLLIPTLGDSIGKLIYGSKVDGEYQLKLHYDRETGKLLIQYWDNYFPLSPESYEALLDQNPDGQGSAFEKVNKDRTLRPFAQFLNNEKNAHEAQKKSAQNLYLGIKDEYNKNEEFQARIDAFLKFYNSDDGRNDFNALHGKQHFRLADWHLGLTDSNHRRFFDITGLIALRQENPEVFEYTHEKLLKLVKDGVIQKLRLDHVDGLADPKGYLEMLRTGIAKCFPDDPERAKTFPIFIEKILENGEKLKVDWDTDGTTGYEALNVLQGLFLNEKAEAGLTQTYQDFTGDRRSFEEILSASKNKILAQSLCSEINGLAAQAKKIADGSTMTCDYSLDALKTAITLIAYEFDSYRTYVGRDGVPDAEDKARIEEVLLRAKKHSSISCSADTIDFIGNMLLGKPPSPENHVANPEQMGTCKANFRQDFQQRCAPLMAIAKENTAYYLYSLLRSLNEVGGDPGKFGTSVEEFHAFNAWQAEHHPRGMVTLQTHDTKLGPLTRSTISAISHVPDDYRRLVEGWKNDNEPFKTNGAPSAHDEMMIYQTIIGALPIDILDNEDERLDAFCERMKAFTIKAIKEGKENTNWINANEAYEKACGKFIDRLLERNGENTFIIDLIKFRKKILPVALQADVAQTVLQIGGPGTVDIYQGIEQYLHRQSLVDPDNRRPVDFKQTADKIRQWEKTPPDPAELVKNPRSGDFFLYTLWQTLKARADNPALFMQGTYEGLTEGEHLKTKSGSTVVAFKRTLGDDSAIVIAPVLKGEDAVTFGRPGASLKSIFNEKAALKVEGVEDGAEYKDVTTGKSYRIQGGALPLAALFENNASGAAVLMRVKTGQEISGPQISVQREEEPETPPPSQPAPAVA